jgi:DNA-binding NarL/FixJ family response regulator
MSSGAKVVIVVDPMEFRRACIATFLKDWSAQEQVEVLALAPDEAHRKLRDDAGCVLLVLNAGGGTVAQPDILAEVKVLRTLATAAALVVVADGEDADDVVAVAHAGAAGYISNLLPPDLALRALSLVLHGGNYFPRSAVDRHFPSVTVEQAEAARQQPPPHSSTAPVTSVVPSAPAASAASAIGGEVVAHRNALPVPLVGLPGLSERQSAILAGLCRGDPNKIIGRNLNLPESTVKVHVREIMRKLGVSNRTQVAIAVARMSQGVRIMPTAPLPEPETPEPFRPEVARRTIPALAGEAEEAGRIG